MSQVVPFGSHPFVDDAWSCAKRAGFRGGSLYNGRVKTLFSVFVVVTMAAAAVAAGSAQPQKPAGAAVDTPHLTVTTSAKRAAKPGDRATLFVDIALKPKMHVYAPEEKESIPVSLTIAPDEGVKAEKTEFPAAEKFYVEPLKLTQLVYNKPFRITQPVTLAKASAAGVTIKGTLRYQACDDKVCYAPKTVPLTWTVQ
jgi:DsbC/DsbD-like thiol-disulfide interchange protein